MLTLRTWERRSRTSANDATPSVMLSLPTSPERSREGRLKQGWEAPAPGKQVADLSRIFAGLHTATTQADVLSPGERQRLGSARLLLNRPPYAFHDEATSAIDVGNEQLMYELLKRHHLPFLSSGHRFTLLKLHGNISRLSPIGAGQSSQGPNSTPASAIR